MDEEKRVLLMLNDIDEGPDSIGHIDVPEGKVEEFRKILLDHDIGAVVINTETLNSVEELRCYVKPEGAGHDMDRCPKHHMHNCPDCHPLPEDEHER